MTSPPRLAFGSNTRRAGLEDRCTGVPARHRPLTMVSTKTRPPASRAPEDGTTAPELARLGHDPACHPRASSATRVSLPPASAPGASRRGPLRALGRGARRRLQKTGYTSLFHLLLSHRLSVLQGKGTPSSPRTRRPMWPILPATSHLRLRSGGFFTPPAQHTAHAAVPYRTDVDPSGPSSCRTHFAARADLQTPRWPP